MTLMAEPGASTVREELPIDTACVEVHSGSQTTGWTARIRLRGGDFVSLHSARNPLAEARQQLAAVDDADPTVVVLVGGGLGFLTEAARTRWPSARVVVLEPVPRLARAARARTPELYQSDKVHVVVGPSYQGAEDLWRAFDVPAMGQGSAPPVVVHPVMARVLPDPMAHAARVVRRAVRSSQMNARARQDNAGRYLLNTLRNLPLIAQGADPADLGGQFDSVPAVIVGAGPSLDRNLPALRTLADRALIVSTDTAWHPLAAANVDPHLVIGVDPTTTNGRHLASVPSRRDTWVLAEGSVDPTALRPLVGRTATFRLAAHHPWPWLQSLGLERTAVDVWGSVLTAAYSLTVGFGCDPIIFVGADLGFTDQRPYCRGTAFEHDWARYTAQGISLREVWQNTLSARELVTEPGVRGEGVLTAPHLVEVRNWLLERAGEAPRRVLNATLGGILHGPGVEQVTLAAALDSQPIRERALRDAIRDSWCQRPDRSITDSLVQQLAELTRQTDGRTDNTTTGPLADWLAFGAPKLTADEIRAALVAAHDGLIDSRRHRTSAVALSETGLPAVSPPRFYEADRVALMRALLTGDRSALDGCERPLEDRDGSATGATAIEAIRLVDDLLARPRLTNDKSGVAADADASAVPLSRRFSWMADAMAAVASLEEQLLGLAPVAQAGLNSSGRHRDAFWADHVTPVLDDGHGIAGGALDGVQGEQAARATLLSHRNTLRRSQEDANPNRHRLDRLLSVIERGVLDPGMQVLRDDMHRLGLLDGSGEYVALPLRVDAVMRAVTGTLATPDDAASGRTVSPLPVWPDVGVVSQTSAPPPDPRFAFFCRAVGFVEPEILTGRDLPRGYSLASLDDNCATFTPHLSVESVRIGSDGQVETGSSWPAPITGEVPWGDEGGALAWNGPDSMILLRTRDGSDTVAEKVSFQPAQVALKPDGAPFWCAFDGGLWDWLPGSAGRFMVKTPPGFLRVEGCDLVLDPFVRELSGGIARQRFSYQWRYDPSSDALRRSPTRPEGQCAAVATRGSWTARTYPFSDLVRIEHSGGGVIVLACHAPFGAAWAGRSLVITTDDGRVLFFRRLLDHIGALT